MRKFKSILILPLITAISACAQSPDAIAPVSMGNAFDGVSCATAQSMLNTSRQNLATLSAQQQSAVTGDAIGVFLIGVPVSSLSGGDKEGLIAAEKGKQIALENRLLTC
jgi:hypothetical protein